VDVRVIAATNADLRKVIEKGHFRHDLFYRLDVLSIALPPLRERKEDIPLLAAHLLAAEKLDKTLSRAALERLRAHDWPGNVRELRNVLVRAALRTASPVLGAEDIEPTCGEAAAPQPGSYGLTLQETERQAILEALRRNDGNASQAASLLGVHRITLYRRMKRHGIRARRDFT
jgi:transcriptional regulator with PAS, ATPase and Fis domain